MLKTTVDLRGWIFDDQNGWYANAGSAPGSLPKDLKQKFWKQFYVERLLQRKKGSLRQ